MGFLEEVDNLIDVDVKKDQLMKKHTTIGVGGRADYFITVNSLFSLKNTILLAKKYRVKYKVIGAGSNLLVSDDGFRGLILKLNLKDVYLTEKGVRAMAGARLNDLVDFCSSHGFSGCEKLYGIPASIGGAVVMNAGAFGSNIGDYVDFVEVLSGDRIKRISAFDCGFKYRTSKFKSLKTPIVAVNFNFDLVAGASSRLAKETLVKRLESFPKGKTFGSVFKNPKGDFAGKIIESCGLKGKRIGGAIVSDKHANFIINDQSASAFDVDTLIKTVKETVKNKTGITLIEEVERVGVF